MSPLAALVLGTLCTYARSWECPAGFAGPEECLGKENAGKCDLQQPTNIEIDTSDDLTCKNPNAKIVEFESDVGSGSYFKGCGVNKAGLTDSCCNCWPLSEALGVSSTNTQENKCIACSSHDNKCCKRLLCWFGNCIYQAGCGGGGCKPAN
ncbi:Gcsh [Symbiodinium pilosum]|uniref:Gcsh protein n=1 Tax=Symbiodinium pilosum TaxID=2952 RepID=A0A812XEL9_SYMPI|nr:Gcsh [Symbiodinium pilosum]